MAMGGMVRVNRKSPKTMLLPLYGNWLRANAVNAPATMTISVEMMQVNREFFKYSPAQFDPIVPGLSYMEAFEEFMLEKFELLKSSGKAKQIHSIS